MSKQLLFYAFFLPNSVANKKRTEPGMYNLPKHVSFSLTLVLSDFVRTALEQNEDSSCVGTAGWGLQLDLAYCDVLILFQKLSCRRLNWHTHQIHMMGVESDEMNQSQSSSYESDEKGCKEPCRMKNKTCQRVDPHDGTTTT